MSINGINAYHQAQQQMTMKGMSPRDSIQDTDFKTLLQPNETRSSLTDLPKAVATSALDTLREAESQTKLAAVGQADPLAVADMVNRASLATEQFTTAFQRLISTVEKIVSTPL